VRALLRIRAAEQASRAAAGQWRATFDAISGAVCLLDEHGKIRRCNRAMAALARRDPEALAGLPLAEALRQGLGLDRPPELAALGGGPAREGQEVRLGERWFHVVADPIRDDMDGAGRGSVVILEDVTPRVRLEEQLRQSQRLEAIGRLAGGIAHDFNNLLTAILGNASLLIRELPPGEPEHALAATIERAAWRAAELTRQLLGFSRQTLLWLVKLEPGRVVENAAGLVRQKLPSGVEFRVQKGDDLWPVQADPGHLEQVLAQLCLNGADAMPGGGRLLLEAGNAELDEGAAARHVEARPGAFVRFRVEDSGTGIPPDVVDKVFDPFFTTKPTGRGSGLGLAMVHGIVKQHQGWVECHSAPGEGTRFDIYLPRAAAEAARPLDQTPMPSRAASPAGGPALVLLADDNDTLRALAAAYLRRGGFEVREARDGREAVELYRREHAGIDVVVLDQMMPRLGGEEALRQMREVNPAVRALLAGGPAADEAAGMIAKPYRERELLQAVRGLLEGAEALRS
jgi:PAS domain S-box-containing protein